MNFRIAIRKMREKGILFYLKKYCKRFFIKMAPKYRKLLVFEMNLKDISYEMNQNKEIIIKAVKDISEINSFIKKREDWYYDYAKNLFEKGNICFIGKVNNEVVSILWTSFNEVYLSDVEYLLRVKKDMVPLIDAYTLPEYRNMGIYKLIWIYCIRYFQQRPEYTKILGFISPKNVRSLSVHRKLNLERVIKEITLLRLFGFKKHFIKDYKKN